MSSKIHFLIHTDYRGLLHSHFLIALPDMEMCSETDSTNECSDFKSELDDDVEVENQQRKTSGLQQTRTKKDSRVVFV